MKTIYAVLLISVALLALGCAQKVNDPADVQAIKDINTAWDKAFYAGNAEPVASIYTTHTSELRRNGRRSRESAAGWLKSR